MFDRDIFGAARLESLAHLRYAKGHRETIRYAYNADLGLWANRRLQEAGKDWRWW